MKVVVIKSNLKEALSVVEKGTGENLNLPILKNVLLEAAENKFTFTTTNLEIGIKYSIMCKIIESGKITVPLQLFHNLMNTLQSERLNLETKQNILEIKSDNYNAKLSGLPPEDFPIIPRIKNENKYIEIKGEILMEMLRKVIIATQFSDLRPELNSVLFDFSIDTLKIAATDSFRLAEKIVGSSQFKTNYEESFKILIPLKTSQELLRILKSEEMVKIIHDENQILFKTEQLEFISRLIEGNFPDYTAIIPKKFDVELQVEKEEFVNALKLASIFGTKNNEVKISISENKKALEISSSDQAIGHNHYLLPAKIKGNLKEIIFNWRYLLDVLKVLESDEIFFGINEGGSASLLKSPGEGSYFYILKPILKA